ncbi:MAG: fluoroacetyl-CoA thioesterase [Mycobacteriales bacterium]
MPGHPPVRPAPYGSGMALEPGLTGAVAAVVGPADTARALGSGDVDVLGTPRVLALLEAATVAAVAGHLPAGQTTVGSRVEVEHLAPTAVGASVRAEAVLTTVDGRRLTFTATLLDRPPGTGGRPVATATIIRVVVDRGRFAG